MCNPVQTRYQRHQAPPVGSMAKAVVQTHLEREHPQVSVVIKVGLRGICVFSALQAGIGNRINISKLLDMIVGVGSPKIQIWPPSLGMATAACADLGAGALGLV